MSRIVTNLQIVSTQYIFTIPEGLKMVLGIRSLLSMTFNVMLGDVTEFLRFEERV
jgi:hypothetical protein